MSKFATTLCTNKRTYEINIKDFKFVNLKELHERDGEQKIHVINGAYLQHGKDGYPDRVVLINTTLKELYPLPSHLTEGAITLYTDTDIVDEVKAGKCGFRVYSYEMYNKLCYSISFVEV